MQLHVQEQAMRAQQLISSDLWVAMCQQHDDYSLDAKYIAS